MKPAPFAFQRADTVDGAIELMRNAQGYAKYIAGGQTLGPMINLRLTQPDAVIDISRIAELRAVSETPQGVRFGAAVRHAEIEDGKYPDPSRGLMARAARGLAYRPIRNRGTIGGSLAHADPVAEWPTVLTALDARVHMRGPSGERELPIGDFLTGYLTTALDDEEILTAVTVPHVPEGGRVGFQKFCRKSGEFAHALTAVVLSGSVGRIALGCASGTPILLPEAAAVAIAADSWSAGLDTDLRRAASRDFEAAGLQLDDYESNLHAAIAARAVREALR